MNRFGNWRDGLPLGVFFALLFVVWTGMQLILRASDRGSLRTSDIAIYSIGGLIFAGLLTGLLAFLRRRSGGSLVYTAINVAVRTGDLPEDAEPSFWAPELQRRHRALVRARISNPIIFGLFAVLGVALYFIGQPTIVAVLLILFFVVYSVYNFFLCRRMLSRVQSLQRQLGAPVTT